MKQISRIIDSQPSNIIQWLSQQLNTSKQQLNQPSTVNIIQNMIQYRQNKIYHFFTNDLNAYFGAIWQHIIVGNPDFQGVILDKMGEKQNNVIDDLMEERIKIIQRMPILPMQYQEQNKINKINLLKQQSDSLRKKINEIDSNLQANNQNQMKDIKDVYNKLYSQSKIKQAEQFVKRNHTEQIQRRKKLQQQRKRQQQALMKKQAEIKAHEEQLAKARRQQTLRKQKQLHEQRQKQKQIRQQRNTQYMRIRKSIQEKPPLYQKLFEGFTKRYQDQQNQRLNRMQSQRKHYLQNITSKLLQQHEKDYDQLREKKEKQRRQREQNARNQAKTRSRAKIHSSYEIKKPIDLKQLQKEQGKQKLEKIKQYKILVKEKFKPKINEDKRKQLMNLIEEMHLGNKHVKRVRLQNGSVMYQQLKPVDHKMIGINYLQQSKQMAAKARQRKKQDKDIPLNDPNKQIKKPINYLEQLRKNRPKQQKTSIVDRKNMSYDDKVKLVMQQSQKLAQITKQNEMMLKFGKFKTSQQILACKQEIDQNYLDIVNMKLKLILSQQAKDEQKSQSQFSKN